LKKSGKKNSRERLCGIAMQQETRLVAPGHMRPNDEE
jgi:hypothetical protein